MSNEGFLQIMMLDECCRLEKNVEDGKKKSLDTSEDKEKLRNLQVKLQRRALTSLVKTIRNYVAKCAPIAADPEFCKEQGEFYTLAKRVADGKPFTPTMIEESFRLGHKIMFGNGASVAEAINAWLAWVRPRRRRIRVKMARTN